MKLSNFFNFIEIKDDVFAIFNTLVMDILFVNRQELLDIIRLNGNSELLIKSGIYIRENSQDEEALKLVKNIYNNNNKKVGLMYFILSTGCNLACKYCFIENNSNNNHSELNMSNDTAILALKKYISYLKDTPDIEKPQIIFYGGEPFVNYEVMKSVVNYAKSQNSDIAFSLVTNATLITDEIIDFLKFNNINVGISIDGPKDINDANRIFRNSSNSVYDCVMKTIEKLKSKEIDYGLSITISQTLLDNKDIFFDWIKKLDVPGIFYNLYHFSESEKNLDWQTFYKEMDNFIFDSFDSLEKIGISDGRIARKIDSILNKEFKFSDCASLGANQLTLKPNGDITLCHGYCKTSKNILGNIYNSSINELINNSNTNLWTKLPPICREECLKCEALHLCGGGCAVQSENLFGDITEIDRCFCIHSKDSLKWLLSKMYNLTQENNYNNEEVIIIDKS